MNTTRARRHKQQRVLCDRADATTGEEKDGTGCDGSRIGSLMGIDSFSVTSLQTAKKIMQRFESRRSGSGAHVPCIGRYARNAERSIDPVGGAIVARQEGLSDVERPETAEVQVNSQPVDIDAERGPGSVRDCTGWNRALGWALCADDSSRLEQRHVRRRRERWSPNRREERFPPPSRQTEMREDRGDGP